jgi:hypothetical protein
MRGESNTIDNTFQGAGHDTRNLLSDIASKVGAGAKDATDAVYNTLGQQCHFTAETLTKAGKKAADLSRRYPLPMVGAALALGFLIGRSRR